MIILVLGGVRSGKSEVAERLAGPGPVTYVATAVVGADDDFAGRVARHRARRPPVWSTVEEPRGVPGLLRRLHGTVLLDALGTWLANDLRADVDGLVDALTARAGDTIVVSEEVGLGVHPPTELGRRFADALGEANRKVAAVADRCLLVVAGRVVELPAGEPGPVPVTDSGPDAGSDPAVPAPAMPTPAGRAGGFRGAVAFLTPLGGAAAPRPSALAWFPAVGALLGLGLGAWWWAAGEVFGPLVAAVLVVAADLALTGALHFDGLVDSADGLLPHAGGATGDGDPAGGAARRLGIMAAPDVGAFGVAAGATVLLARVAALAALDGPRPLLLAALWTASRTAMAATLRSGTYARPGGLATAFRDSDRPAAARAAGALAAGGAALALALAAADGVAAVAAVVAAVAAAGLVHELARRRLGGYTGDTLGAGGVAGETAGLLAATAVAL